MVHLSLVRPNDVLIHLLGKTHIVPFEAACWVSNPDGRPYMGWVLHQEIGGDLFHIVVFKKDDIWICKSLPAYEVTIGRDHMERGENEYYVDLYDWNISNPYLLEYQHADSYFTQQKPSDRNRVYDALAANPHAIRTKVEDMLSSWEMRDLLIHKYAWAIPNEEAISAITQLCLYHKCGVVEIGAGRGYWAYLLKEHGGIQVHAYDIEPPDKITNSFFTKKDEELLEVYHPVLKGNENKAARHPKDVLLIVWPYMAEWAYESVKNYFEAGGHHVVYVGEGWGGCTANDAFFRYLDHYAEDIRDIHIPQWDGIRDSLTIWKQKKNVEPLILTRTCRECAEDVPRDGFHFVYGGFETRLEFKGGIKVYQEEVCSTCYAEHIIQHLLPADCE